MFLFTYSEASKGYKYNEYTPGFCMIRMHIAVTKAQTKSKVMPKWTYNIEKKATMTHAKQVLS